jgi:protein-disulfide isomerase
VYGDRVRLVWKHLPLEMHKQAPAAHLASVAAWRQGRFWEFHDKLFANQKQLDLETFRQHARDLGLDMERFEKDLIDPENKKLMDADLAEAKLLGLTGTPGFFVNGRYLRGAKPFADFAALINEELSKQNLPVPPEAVIQ